MSGVKWRPPYPVYDPSADSALKLWVDFSDSSTSSLLDTGGGSISDGETIGTAKSKAGTARNFTQWGAITRPVWVANGINGLGVGHFNVQTLASQTTMSDFNSMSGTTVVVVHKVVSQRSASEGLDCVFNSTQAEGGVHFRSQMYIASRSDAKNRVGGRRLPDTAFAYVTSTIVPQSNGSIVTGVYDWANAKASSYEGGVRDHIGQTFQTSGNTSASEPFALSLGAIAQEGDTIGDSCNSYIGEVLLYLTAMTADQLLPVHHYLRRKWNPTQL